MGGTLGDILESESMCCEDDVFSANLRGVGDSVGMESKGIVGECDTQRDDDGIRSLSSVSHAGAWPASKPTLFCYRDQRTTRDDASDKDKDFDTLSNTGSERRSVDDDCTVNDIRNMDDGCTADGDRSLDGDRSTSGGDRPEEVRRNGVDNDRRAGDEMIDVDYVQGVEELVESDEGGIVLGNAALVPPEIAGRESKCMSMPGRAAVEERSMLSQKSACDVD